MDFETLLYTFACVMRKYMLILDIDDQNATYVISSKGTSAM